MPTDIELQPGDPLHLEADGAARVVGMRLRDWFMGTKVDHHVGPQGTYLWPRDDGGDPRATVRAFALPAMADGPFPAFCLIGKVGEDGTPFYVGARYDGTADRAGRLWLGINDDDPADNRGRFRVTVERASRPLPPTEPLPRVAPGQLNGHPIAAARVLLLYVDGLRPDALHEMAQAGFLPNFKRAFLDQGIEVADAFSVFPSNTLIANGSLFTGYFSDRTGIKSQNQFERATLKTRGQMSEWLPDGFIPKPVTRVINLLDKYAPENTHAFLAKRGVPTLASRLGQAFQYTTLPIVPMNPPPQWFHRAINTLGPFDLAHRLPLHLDRVNADYAMEELLGNSDARVIAVWFPMADKTSHHSRRGQFGAARRDLALADRYLGRLLERLRELRWDRSTYLILVSDHGHLGGEPGREATRACNLARDWAHQQLGCNVKVVGQEWMHAGIDTSRFLFFDNQGAGQAKVFLPYGSYFRGAWQRNRLAELMAYQVRPLQSMNLLESLIRFRPPEWDGQGPRPVDLILVKLDEQRTLVYRDEASQAIIHRARYDTAERFRYEPIRAISQSANGELLYKPPLARVDPLGYLQDAQFLAAVETPAWIDADHTDREWLAATARTRYPDAVVTMAKFFAWSDSFKDLAAVRDPDLVITASQGWSFRSDDGEGTDHGYPLRESMRMSWFVSGPNIPHGVWSAPQRLVDVAPTILDMISWSYDPAELDGQALRGIYE